MTALPASIRLLAAEDFAPYVGRLFDVDATPAAVGLRLDDILRHAPLSLTSRMPFTLIFSTPFATLLVAGNYRMRAPDGTAFTIDMVPTQTAPGPRRAYHAVFS